MEKEVWVLVGERRHGNLVPRAFLRAGKGVNCKDQRKQLISQVQERLHTVREMTHHNAILIRKTLLIQPLRGYDQIFMSQWWQ